MPHDLEHELRTHSAALRELARRLVGDGRADDVVQDVSLQALQRPPRRPAEVPGGLRGWLLAVARRSAGRLRRSAARRQHHEGAVVAADASGSPFADAARMEAVTRLHDALRALGEPHRGTLLQRFFEDLTPSEIAARSGCPVATVKSRLQRGLAMLRSSLDSQRGDWRAAFAIAFGLPPGAVATTGFVASVGGLAAACAIGGGGVAAVAAVAVWSWSTPTLPGGAIDPAPSATSPVVDAAPRIPVPAVPSTMAQVQLRVLDTRGVPLPGARVHHWLPRTDALALGAAERAELDAMRFDPAAQVARFGAVAVADGEGIARWPRRTSNDTWWHAVVQVGDTFGEQWLPAAADEERVFELRLALDVAFRVQVIDARGEPANGIYLEARHPNAKDPTHTTRRPLARTDATGFAVVPHVQVWRDHVPGSLASRPIELHADVPGTMVVGDLDLAAPPTAPVVLRLPPTGVLEAHALDAAGMPITNDKRVVLRLVPSVSSGEAAAAWPTSVDARGVASFPHVALGRRWQLDHDADGGARVVADGPRRERDVVRVELRPDPVPVLVARLVRGDEPAARVRVALDAGGHPLAADMSPTDDEGLLRVPCTLGNWRGRSLQNIRVTCYGADGLPDGWSATWSGERVFAAGENDLGTLVLTEAAIVVAGHLEASGPPPTEWPSLWVEAATGSADAPWQHVLSAQVAKDGTFVCRGNAPAAPLRLCVWTRSRWLPVAPVPFAAGQRDCSIPLAAGGSVRASAIVASRELLFSLQPLLVPVPPQPTPVPFTRYLPALDPAVPVRQDIVDETANGEVFAFTWPAIAPGRYRFELRTRHAPKPLLEVHDVVVRDGQPTDDARLQRLQLPAVNVIDLRLPQAKQWFATREGRPAPNGAGIVFVLDGDLPTDSCQQIDSDLVLLASAQPLDVLVRMPGHRDLVVRGLTTGRTLELAPAIAVTLQATLPELPADAEVRLELLRSDDPFANARPWVYSPAAGGSVARDATWRQAPATATLAAGGARFLLGAPGRYQVLATWRDRAGNQLPLRTAPDQLTVRDAGGTFAVQLLSR